MRCRLVLVLVLGDDGHMKHSFISCPFLPCGHPDVSWNCWQKELSLHVLAMSSTDWWFFARSRPNILFLTLRWHCFSYNFRWWPCKFKSREANWNKRLESISSLPVRILYTSSLSLSRDLFSNAVKFNSCSRCSYAFHTSNTFHCSSLDFLK